MIRSIITIAALGFALAGCASAPAIAPAPAPAPVVAPSPMQQYQSAIEQAQNDPNVQAGDEWLSNQSPQLQQMVDDVRQQQDRNVQQLEEQNPQIATGGMDCQGGPDGATVCEGGSAEENQKAAQQGDTEYMEFCQQQATKPAMCQQMGY